MIAVLNGILWLLRFAIGACVFSFFNVVIYRLPKGESVVHGRSHCMGCGKTLTAGELIPCVSYLIQGKKCRGCGGKISGRYFKVELAGGLAFVCCCAFFGYGELGLLSLRGLIAFAYLGILIIIALIDWDTKIIYDRFHIIIVLLGIAALWLFPEHPVADRLIGAAAVSLPMLLIAIAIEGAFGGGDIKLMAASGFLLAQHPYRHVPWPAYRQRLRHRNDGREKTDPKRPFRLRPFPGPWPGYCAFLRRYDS